MTRVFLKCITCMFFNLESFDTLVKFEFLMGLDSGDSIFASRAGILQLVNYVSCMLESVMTLR